MNGKSVYRLKGITMNSWEESLNALMKELGPTLRVNGDKGSKRTEDATKETWTAVKNVLHKLGYKIQNPRNLGNNHVEMVVKYWHSIGRANKTMEGHLSRLRVVCDKIGKRGMVKSLKDYLPHVAPELLVVRTAAKKSKSWTEAGVDISEKLIEADRIDMRFGLMLRVQLAFGLRRKEVLTCHPWKSASGGIVWRIFPEEGKGGRPRVMVIETQLQRDVIALVQSKLKKGERLRWKTTARGLPCNMERAEEIYKRSMKRIGMTQNESGVTGHGLRAQFAENEALRIGFVPPTLGGDGGELPKEDLDNLRSVVSESLGHSRKDITRAYYGSFKRYTTRHEKERLKLAVEEGLEVLKKNGPLEMPAEERKEDCLKIIGILASHDIAIDMRQIHTLWTLYSGRQNSEWLKVDDAGEIERGVYVAATMHRRNAGSDGEEGVHE